MPNNAKIHASAHKTDDESAWVSILASTISNFIHRKTMKRALNFNAYAIPTKINTAFGSFFRVSVKKKLNSEVRVRHFEFFESKQRKHWALNQI